MKRSPKRQIEPRQAAKLVRSRIESGGERLWRTEDFDDLPFAAVARTLSRLMQAGVIQRLSKGTYYLARQSSFGESRPNPKDVRKLAERHKSLFPAGVAAANILGFSTQTAKHPELATSASSLPRKLVGSDTIIYTRRPDTWADLTQQEAAIFDFLRRGGRTSELSPEDTVRRITKLLSESNTFTRLAHVALREPPRVRAILGALGERMDADKKVVARLKKSLNPLSRFDFGIFSDVANARQWQAKRRRP